MTLDAWILELVYALNGYGIILYVLITTFIASILAFSLGLERQIRGTTGSLKIHVLLAASCALLMSVSIWAIRFADGTITFQNGEAITKSEIFYDTSRVAAAVITGIGFIGAGAIIKDNFSVKGLSSAASLWIAASIGLACGSGFILESVVFTALVFLFLLSINLVNRWLAKKAEFILVRAKRGTPIIKLIHQTANENDINFKKIEIVSIDEEYVVAKVLFPYHCSKALVEYFKSEIINFDGVTLD